MNCKWLRKFLIIFDMFEAKGYFSTFQLRQLQCLKGVHPTKKKKKNSMFFALSRYCHHLSEK